MGVLNKILLEFKKKDKGQDPLTMFGDYYERKVKGLEDRLNKRGNDFYNLIEWLQSEKYLIDEYSTTMTEEFENTHKWELSRNRMINKTIAKIEELIKK